MSQVHLFVKISINGYFIRPDGSPFSPNERVNFKPVAGEVTVGWDEGCALKIPHTDTWPSRVILFHKDTRDRWYLRLPRGINSTEIVHIGNKTIPTNRLPVCRNIMLMPEDRGSLSLFGNVAIDFSVMHATPPHPSVDRGRRGPVPAFMERVNPHWFLAIATVITLGYLFLLR